MICHLYLALSHEHALPMPSLGRLLAVGKVTHHETILDEALCRTLSVLPQQDWPLASLCWLGEGNDPGSCYWLRADPVHLVLQRDCFSLSAPVPLAVASADAQALIASLNQHFAPEGLKFYIANSGSWYLQLQTPPAIRTSAPQAAIGRDVSSFMPQGQEAAKWARLLNEMQMLLFEHPVNQARELRGEPAINSLWLSGGGVLAGGLATSDLVVYAHSPLAKGLAKAANLSLVAPPQHASSLLNKAHSDIVVVLEDTGDVDSNWFAPLLQALRRRQVSCLSMHVAIGGQLLQGLVKPADTWKFWRKTRPLQRYLHG